MSADNKAKVSETLEAVSNMSLIEVVELTNQMRVKFDVPEMPVPAPVQAAAGAAPAEEKTEFNVELKEVGPNKINVIKIVREETGLGLKEAKDLVESAPVVIKEGISKADAEKLLAKLTDAKAVGEIK